MNNKFILINDTIPHSGKFNMEFDEWLFELHKKESKFPFFRIYRWNGLNITTGKFHNIEKEINIKECKRLGISITKRPTGGRAILHNQFELTFSIVISEPIITPFNFKSVFLFAAENLCSSLKLLNIKAEINLKPTNYKESPLCFHTISQYEIIDKNRNKIAGIAQLFKKSMALIQVSIPYRKFDFDYSKLFNIKKGIHLDNELIRKNLNDAELADAIIAGFDKIEFIPLFRNL